VARRFRPQPGLPPLGGGARRARARRILCRPRGFFYRPCQHGEGGVRGSAPLVSTAQRLCGLGRRQVLDGPGPELPWRGPSRTLRPRRSAPAQPGRGRGGAAALALAGAARPLAREGRPGVSAAGEHGPAEECFRRAWALLEEDVWFRWRWHIPLLRARGEFALAEGRHDEAWTLAAQSLDLATQTDSRKHVARALRLQGEVLAATGRLDEASAVLEASIRVATDIQTPREVWLGKAVLGKVLARLRREQEAEVHLTQATHAIEVIAAKLTRPDLRRSFLGAEPVVDLYRTLAHRPPTLP
jgi:Tetratricopeptide repeat